MMRVFIGYDRRETVAFHVAGWSLMRRSSIPVSITGLMLPQLPLKRAAEGSTEFSFSRFLTPWLSDYQGYALFMDCDVLVRGDVAELLRVDAQQLDKPLRVVKHPDYVPRDTVKFLNQPQQAYPRKNWSSVMLFRAASCSALTPDYVNRATGLQLHQFRWLQDREIGDLPREWNHLVGEHEPNPDAKLAHFTLGGPWFPEYADCEFADEWRAERDAMLRAG